MPSRARRVGPLLLRAAITGPRPHIPHEGKGTQSTERRHGGLGASTKHYSLRRTLPALQRIGRKKPAPSSLTFHTSKPNRCRAEPIGLPHPDASGSKPCAVSFWARSC